MTLFTEQERAEIARAIAEAETRTSGEVVAVVATASSDYRFVPLLWAALAALAVPLPLLMLTDLTPHQVYALQLLAFGLGAVVCQWRPLRHALVPGAIKRARAHRHARAQFLAQNLHTTAGRTGVLIFVSEAERYAEIVADTGIYSRVDAAVWVGIVDDLVAHFARGQGARGFIAAIEACGTILAEHFPPAPRNADELPNHLIVISEPD